MKMLSKTALAFSTALAVLAGCSSNPAPPGAIPGPDAASPKNELFIYTVWPSFYEDEEVFQKQIGEPLKAKFPDLTVRHMHWDRDKKQDYKDLWEAGTYPDIIIENTRPQLMQTNNTYDFLYNITELVKMFNFDTSKLNQAALAHVKNLTPGGELVGLPFQLSDFVLFYNKDIFDKFDIDYPRDGMTYDEVYELAKQLTVTDGDVAYKGYQQHPALYMKYNQLSLSPLSLTEDRLDFGDPGWARLVDNLRRFYEIPGNAYKSVDDFPLGNIAISVHVSEKIIQWYNQNNNLNFDIAAMPSFSDVPMTKAQPNMYSLFVTKQSNNKELAFQAIAHLLSEEVQTEFSRNGIIGPLESETVQAEFGQYLPQMQGKNTQAIFYSKNAMPPAARPSDLIHYDPPYQDIFIPHIFENGKDTLSALKAVEEAANAKIEQIKMERKNAEQQQQQ